MSKQTEMPFTGHSADELSSVLESIYKCDLPVEVFDAFLSEYAETEDLNKARLFAANEWDC